MTNYVHTLGDSTLDNLYWLTERYNMQQAKSKSVEGLIKKKLGSSHQVESHAYDGFTTSTVLNGGEIGAVLRGASNLNAYIAEKASSFTNKQVRPLDKLSKEINKNPDATHYVVISVGGNDFRENLGNPIRLLGDVSKVQERYLSILDKVKNMNPNVKPVLMFLYRTDAVNDCYGIYTILKVAAGLVAIVQGVCMAVIAAAGVGFAAHKINSFSVGVLVSAAAIILAASSFIVPFKITKGILFRQDTGMTLLGALMEKFYKPILERAKKDNLPILDLPNSFNPYDSSLYISGIEPSEKGGRLIADGISRIIKTNDDHVGHDYKSGKIYTCDGKESEIPDDWHVLIYNKA